MRTSFSKQWRFSRVDPNALDSLHFALTPEFDDADWRLLDLPHDWSIELPRHPKHRSGPNGGFFEDGMGWYRKRFEVPMEWKKKRVILEFEGAYHQAELWMNGRVLANHAYGYTGFFVDLTDWLKWGESNVLAVRLDTVGSPHSRWYAGSGLYRPVWMHLKDPVHLEPWGIGVTTPSVESKVAQVRVTTEVRNTVGSAQDVTLEWSVKDPSGKEVAQATATSSVQAEGVTVVEHGLDIESPQLWSIDTPRLYQLETRVTSADGSADTEDCHFGVRTFRFTPDEGFVLNDERVLLKGGCVHHDCGPLGAQCIDRAEERKVELMKASGFNAVRCAHNPPSIAFLDACDRLGVVVMDEAFDVWQLEKVPYDYHKHFDQQWENDLNSMLRRDRNHPSVVLWSIGNELIERGFPEGARIATMLADHVRKVEPSRPVTAGICDLWGAGPWTQLDGMFKPLDVCGYNYEVKASIEDRDQYPERVIVATESFPNKAFDYWKAVENHTQVAGDFVWTALDYLGESGIGRMVPKEGGHKHMGDYPWHHANCGDIDLCGWKRPQSYYRDVLWGIAEKPYIAVHCPCDGDVERVESSWGWADVQSRWTWPGSEGSPLRVDVYADAESVELFLNGDSLGVQPATEVQRYCATFEVPYAPGELKVVATKGDCVSENMISTSGPAVRLALEVDRSNLNADDRDLAFVTVQAFDAKERLVPLADHTVYFTVQGVGGLAAVASADPRNTEPYRGNVHSLWRGKALAVVRPTGCPGEIVLEAHADGLKGDSLTLACR